MPARMALSILGAMNAKYRRFRGRHLTILLSFAMLVPVASIAAADDSPPPISVRPSVELGFLDIPFHTLQFGEGTDTFDYVDEGGQEILFPYQRLRIDIGLGERQRHHVSLLYQPLTIETESRFVEDRTIDTVTFNAGQAVRLVYGFDFWRGSWVYRVIDTPDWQLDTGLSFQIRNASIRFAAQEGDELVVSQDTGPVPVVRGRVRRSFSTGWWLEGEIDGFYATNSFVNGARYPFSGWIWDAALSAGIPVYERTEAFLTLRSIGGGAEGTADEAPQVWTQSRLGGNERYTSNAIVTWAMAAGFRLTLGSP